MVDLVRALLGPHKCDWCIYRNPSWIDRLMRGDRPVVKHKWYESAWFAVKDWITDYVPVWKLAQKWHFRYH